MKIICIMGRSGCGKSTLESAMEKAGYSRMISYTTRKPRGKERDGKEYHFVSREEFEQLLGNGVLMEYAEYRGNLYGSPKPYQEKNVVVVEPNGYRRIKRMFPEETIGIYIEIPESMIAERISRRNDMTAAEIAKRTSGDEEVFKDIKGEVDFLNYPTAKARGFPV